MVYKDYFDEFIEKKDYHLKRAQDNILALENTILSNTKHITQQLDDLKKLKDEINQTLSTRGYLLGLDKRILYCREDYKALNLLLQSAGAIIMKRVVVNIHNNIV